MKTLRPGPFFRIYCRYFPGKRAKLPRPRVFRHFQFGSVTYLTVSLVFLFCSSMLRAQMGIANFTTNSIVAASGTTYTGPGGGIGAQPEYMPSSNNTFTYNFGINSGQPAGSMPVTGYTIDGGAFTVLNNVITSVVMRRVDNATTTGNRDILFYTGTRNPDAGISGQTNTAMTLNLSATYVPDMGAAFSQNNLFIGTDNILSNQGNGNGNNNNIERVDVMIVGGHLITDSYKYGFPILERGTYGVHDAFKIAVVTAIDGSGNPSAYSNVLSVTANSYNNIPATNPVADGTYTYFLFRRDGTANLEANQHIGNQGIGGVAFRFSDFGIANNTVVYGYSILANDFSSASGADVVDYTNATYFPTNTNESIGGLDLLAVMGIAMETDILPLNLLNFNIKAQNGKPLLQWSTVPDPKCEKFYIERSINGTDWGSIGFVPAQSGQGPGSMWNYQFVDDPGGPGRFYYRLRQKDIDSKEKLSVIRTFTATRDAPNNVVLYPNPASGFISIIGLRPGMEIRVLDLHGAVLQRISNPSPEEMIPLDRYQAGVYLVQLSEQNATLSTLRFLKQ